jgi:hypothetical protein
MNKNRGIKASVKKIHEAYSKYKAERGLPKFLNVHKNNKGSGASCKEAKSPAIIVPYRDNKFQNRAGQLKQFLAYFSKEYPKGAIYIVEQSDDGKKFNRGKLLNVGFEIAKKDGHDLFIFHDVDLIPDQKMLEYYTLNCDGVIHLGFQWKEKYTFEHFLGGVTSMNAKSFELVNGYPNDRWGWGSEDDSLMNRVMEMKLPVIRPDEGVIKEIEHKPTPNFKELTLEPVQKKKLILKNLEGEAWKNNGLSSLKYKVVSEKKVGKGGKQVVVDI